MKLDVSCIVNVGYVGAVKQVGCGVALEFKTLPMSVNIHFDQSVTYLRFAEQVSHIAEDVTRTLRGNIVNSLIDRKDGFTPRHCLSCEKDVDAPVDARFCHRCGDEFPLNLDAGGE